MHWQVVGKLVGQAKPRKGHRYLQADTDTQTYKHKRPAKALTETHKETETDRYTKDQETHSAMMIGNPWHTCTGVYNYICL